MIKLKTKNEMIGKLNTKLNRNYKIYFNEKYGVDEIIATSFVPTALCEIAGLPMCTFGPMIEWINSFTSSYSLDKAFASSQQVALNGVELMKAGLYLLVIPAGVVTLCLTNLITKKIAKKKYGQTKEDFSSAIDYLGKLQEDGKLPQEKRDKTFALSRTILGEEAIGFLPTSKAVKLINGLKEHREELLQYADEKRQEEVPDDIVSLLKNDERIQILRRRNRTSRTFNRMLDEC